MRGAVRYLASMAATAVGLLFIAMLVQPDTASAQKTKQSGAELCYSCHQELQAKFRTGDVHAPVLEGACEHCHSPHASRFPLCIALAEVAKQIRAAQLHPHGIHGVMHDAHGVGFGIADANGRDGFHDRHLGSGAVLQAAGTAKKTGGAAYAPPVTSAELD